MLFFRKCTLFPNRTFQLEQEMRCSFRCTLDILRLFEGQIQELWSVVAERSGALDLSPGVVRMWVRIPACPVAALVSLSKTLHHNCFVLRVGRKDVGPVCGVMHVKEPRTLIVKEKGLAPVFLDWLQMRQKAR